MVVGCVEAAPGVDAGLPPISHERLLVREIDVHRVQVMLVRVVDVPLLLKKKEKYHYKTDSCVRVVIAEISPHPSHVSLAHAGMHVKPVGGDHAGDVGVELLVVHGVEPVQELSPLLGVGCEGPGAHQLVQKRLVVVNDLDIGALGLLVHHVLTLQQRGEENTNECN